MYRAKDDGKGRHVVFEPEMYTALLDRLELEADLRLAVDRGEFGIVYQPIVELESGALIGVEALVRWLQPGKQAASSASFIPLAEQTGLIVPIGRWVLREACRQGREWQLASTDDTAPTISVNVSARQLADPNFTDDVASALADTRLPAGPLDPRDHGDRAHVEHGRQSSTACTSSRRSASDWPSTTSARATAI